MKKILLVVLCVVMVFGTSTVLAEEEVVALPEAQKAVEEADAAPLRSTSQIDIAQRLLDDAKALVDALPKSEDKETLVKNVDRIQEEINLNRQRLIGNAEYHVSRFEENPTDETLATNAQASINALPEDEREDFQERYDAAVEEVALAEAQEAVEEAEAVNPIAANSTAINEAQDLLDEVVEVVEALEDSEGKTALEERIEAQQAEIDAANLQRLIDNAEYHVSRFEENPTDETLKNTAQAAINALPETERTPYQERYAEAVEDEAVEDEEDDELVEEVVEEITRKTFYTFQIGNEFYTYKNADGNTTRFLMDVKPYILNDRTMLPMRYTAYTLGLQVAYDDTTRTAVFLDGDTVVTINIDSNEVRLNDSVVKLDAPIQNIDGRLMTPVSQIAKLFGRTNGDWNDGIAQDIEWVNEYRLVFIFD